MPEEKGPETVKDVDEKDPEMTAKSSRKAVRKDEKPV